MEDYDERGREESKERAWVPLAEGGTRCPLGSCYFLSKTSGSAREISFNRRRHATYRATSRSLTSPACLYHHIDTRIFLRNNAGPAFLLRVPERGRSTPARYGSPFHYRDNWSDSPAFLTYPNAHVSRSLSKTNSNFTLPFTIYPRYESSLDERGLSFILNRHLFFRQSYIEDTGRVLPSAGPLPEG